MISFFVRGEPVQKGSAKAFVVPAPGTPTGVRAVVVPDNKKPLRNWENLVRTEAAAHADAALLEGPVEVTLRFVLPRPQSHTKAERAVPWHTKQPDLDKLGRAILDGLTAIVYHDDKQVCVLNTSKLYSSSPEDVPGVWITVEKPLDF